MKKVTLPKFVVIICAFFLVLGGFFCGYKCGQELTYDKIEQDNIKAEKELREKKLKEEKEKQERQKQLNKFVIVTNSKYMTMQNDGGSYTNIYFDINLNDKKVIKKADKYVGFEGFEYEGKEIATKDLSSDEVTELKKIVDEVVKSKAEEKENDFTYYTLKYNNKEYKIFDKEIIDKITSIVEKKDE